MLISYPVLPAGADNQTERQKFDAMLAMTQQDRGLYPVTTGNRWHGGIHLSPGDEPIRAIADGIIVAYRLAPETKDYPGQGPYDTSFVLIRHETDSGEHTRVAFYSLYMHLRPKALLSNTQRQQLAPFLRDAATSNNAARAPANTRIWRKEALGFAGQLYGHATVHFEIFAAEADFNAFWRDRSTIAPGAYGSNDYFGNSYFIIPANRQFAERHPRAVAPHRISLPGRNQFYDLDVGQAGQNNDRLLVISQMAAGRRIATTFRMDERGRISDQVGDPVQQDDYEYELYRLATALYPDRPSAGFEYLRFGRILGPDSTARVENWQLIRYSDTAIGYINLADPNHQVSVLSDADFPILWQRLEEGEAASPADGIANTPRLSELLQLPEQPTGASLFAPPDFVSRTRNADIAATLRHLICKHPSEWDAGDLENRYAALRQPSKPLHGDDAWNAFKEHVEAMAFWTQAGIPERSVWHFHPLQFINHYRRCLWLSNNEFARCLPRRWTEGRTESVTNWATAIGHANQHAIPYNTFIRKYCGFSRKRYAHNIAQTLLETDFFAALREYSRGHGYPYEAFYGRGYHHITWAGNYRDYGTYKGIANHVGTYRDNRITAASRHAIDSGGATMTWSPRYDPDLLASDLSHAGEASGYFWVSKSFRGRKNMNRVGDLPFNGTSVGFACWLINGGGNGYARRQQYAKFIQNVLMDEPLLHGRQTFTYPPLNNQLTGAFPPAQNIPYTANQGVDYEPQIPPA